MSSSSLCDSCGLFLTNVVHDEQCKIIRKYECSDCKKTFGSMKYLQQHRKIHVQNFYECEFCKKLLKTKRNLVRHYQFVHNECQESFKCAICDDKFLHKFDLRRHIKIHSEKLFHCPKCKKQFHFKYNLNRHMSSCLK